MDTHEVNIKIAKALGYTVDIVPRSNRRAYVRLIDRDGGFCGNVFVAGDEDALSKFIENGLLPDWSTDIAAAIELVESDATHSRWSVERKPTPKDNYRATIGYTVHGPAYDERANTPAMALCLAWLAALAHDRDAVWDDGDDDMGFDDLDKYNPSRF